MRRLIGRFGDRSKLWVCYEAGPTGYELHRLLASMGVRCDVVAPSLVPKGRGDKVKTDKRDARRLAGLHRAGELTAVGVPTRQQEAVRDLCRTRGDMVEDLTRARNRLTKFLLRHGIVYRSGSNWTFRHARWLDSLRFDEPALESTFVHYRATVVAREAALAAVEADLVPWCDRDPFGVAGGAPGRLSRCHPHGRAVSVRRGVRLAPLPSSSPVHELHRTGPLRGLHRRPRTSRSHHQSRQRPSARPARRSGMVLSPPSSGRARASPSATRPPGRRRRPIVAGPTATVVTVPHTQRPQERQSVVAAAVARELAGFLWAEMHSDNTASSS